MARRIGLAQALINDPDLLILDEPTTGLDPIGTRQIKDLILQLAKRGKTVLLCSHLLADVEDVCDRIAVLYGGQIQAEGKVRELLQQSHKTQIITDTLSDDTIQKIRNVIDDEEASLDISSPMEKLETFFIRTVVEAQKQSAPTSGAVSTTQIGDFLTAEARQNAILEKLVTASEVSPKTQQPSKIEKPTPVETTTGVDNELLEQLTDATETTKTTPAVKPEPAKEQPEPAHDVDHDLLRELTGSDEDKNKQQDNPDNNQGGSGHA
jgi:ABC-2 type transport system ATP-binding protein